MEDATLQDDPTRANSVAGGEDGRSVVGSCQSSQSASNVVANHVRLLRLCFVYDIAMPPSHTTATQKHTLRPQSFS